MTATERYEVKRKAKRIMKEHNKNVYIKDIVLLESSSSTRYGFEFIDYIMFRDSKTDSVYQLAYGEYDEYLDTMWTVIEIEL